MSSALIGFTGFVGGTLLRQTGFDDLYNSSNIASIAGREYDLVVCAGAPAEKWRANADPDADREGLSRLSDPLIKARIKELILISTIDVYPVPREVSEISEIDPMQAMPYGRHRRFLEMTLAAHFPTLVIRLPGLFGLGLKKNIIFDLMHDNQVDKIHPDGVFQFYGLDHLWHDIEIARHNVLALVNFATEPVSVRDIAREAFDRVFETVPPTTPARYDVRSIHAPLFGGAGGYLQDRPTVLTALRRYVATERATTPVRSR